MKRWLGLVAGLACVVPAVLGGELFVANDAGNRWDIEVYRSGDSGNMYPVRVIASARPLMDWPWAVAVDSQRLYVANYTSGRSNLVSIFNRAASGTNSVPERTISCELGMLCKALAVDAESIIVGTALDGVLTFPIAASGMTNPLYRIYGGEHGLENLGGMAADADSIYVGISEAPGAIHVFRRSDNGAVAPQRTLRCSAYNLRNVGALAVDARRLYVLSDPGTTTNRCIMVFDKSASGDILPLRRIQGANTGLSDPMGIAVDDRYIYVTSRDRNRILAFPIAADGNVPPHHIISSEYPNPHLFAPHGLAVDAGAPSPDPRVGPSIAADGIRGAVTVAYPAPISISVSAQAGPYAGVPVDWFAVAVPDAGSEWYYLDASGSWMAFPAADLAACAPALQWYLEDIIDPRVVLNAYTLAPGGYTFYFIVDSPPDGALNLTPGQYLSDTVRIEVLSAP